MAQKYTVKKGDSALTLGKKFAVPPQTILNQNRIKSLTAGQTVRIPTTRKKGQAGYYSTGEGERKIVTIGGQQIRMGPNSSISPQQTVTPMQQFINNLMGTGMDTSGAMTAAAPNSLAGIPLQGLTQQQMYYLGTVPQPTGGPKVMPSPTQFTPQWGQAGAGMNSFANQGLVQPPVASGLINTPFSSAGSQARMNEAYVPAPQQAAPFMTQSMPPPIQTGYADYGQRVNQGLVTPTNALPTSQAAPLITPSSRAAGQAQFLAGEGINPESGYIPTRGDVWQMKVNARRRKQAKQGGDAPQQQQEETVAGNASNAMVNWRV
jgi:hypothetical protein